MIQTERKINHDSHESERFKGAAMPAGMWAMVMSDQNPTKSTE
jgi:hypothetical protein